MFYKLSILFSIYKLIYKNYIENKGKTALKIVIIIITLSLTLKLYLLIESFSVNFLFILCIYLCTQYFSCLFFIYFTAFVYYENISIFILSFLFVYIDTVVRKTRDGFIINS